MDQQVPSQPPSPGAPAQPPGGGWGQPPSQPPAQPPAWGQPAPPEARPAGWVMPAERLGPVTGLSKLGALVLFLFGLLWTAIGVVFIAIGGVAKNAFDNAGLHGLGDVAGGVVIGFGVVILVFAVVEVLTGIFAWRGSGVARVLGVLYGLFFGVGSLLVAVSGERSDVTTNAAGAVAVLLVFAICYLYTVAVFIFRWRAPA